MKSFLHSPLLLTLLSLLFLHTSPLFGATDATDTKVKKIPFHGKIVALDQAAKTITLNGKSARTLHVTPTTKVTDGSGNATTLSSATVGEDVGGSYDKADMSLFSLRIGAKLGSKTASTTPEPMATAPAAPVPAAESTPAQTASADAAAASKPNTTSESAKKTRFSGKVTAVDAGASTFTIKSRTFSVSSATAITDAGGAAGSMSTVVVGQKVSGTYEKSADGKSMTVDSLKISK